MIFSTSQCIDVLLNFLGPFYFSKVQDRPETVISTAHQIVCQTSSSSFPSEEGLPRKAFPRSTGHFKGVLFQRPPSPLIVNFDGQRLSPSLFLSPPISREKLISSSETQFSQIALRACGWKAFEVQRDRKQQFICERENFSQIQSCTSFARRACRLHLSMPFLCSCPLCNKVSLQKGCVGWKS